MKKIFSLLIVGSVFNSVNAQEASSSSSTGKKFNFGLKVNPGISWLKPDDTKLSNDGAKLSFGYGIVTDFNFTDNYSFSTGLEINNIRGAFRQTITEPLIGAVESSVDVKTQYLTLPFAIKMKTKEIGAMKYFGQFGLNSSFRLKSKADVSSKVLGIETTTKNQDITEDIHLFRESLVVALGVEYNLAGTTSAFASVGYDNGFLDLVKDASVPGKITSKMITLNVGVLF